MSPSYLQVGQTVFPHDPKISFSAIRQFKPQNVFSGSQTLLDTTTHSKSPLNNLKVGLALLSALQNWDGTVRVPFFPVAVFSKHCVCAQLLRRNCPGVQCWLLLLSWECQSSCLCTDPSFIKTAPSTCALGSSVVVSPFLGQTANTGWFGGASAGLRLSPLRNSHLTGQSLSVQSSSCQLPANGSSSEHRTLTKAISTLQITSLIKWIWFGSTPSTFISRAFL